MSVQRDRFAELFSHIVDRGHGVNQTEGDAAEDADVPAAQRLLANALLNYVSETDADQLRAVEDALPWLHAYLGVGADGTPDEPAGLADRLTEAGALRAVGPRLARRQLAGPDEASLPAAMGRLADIDTRLHRLADLETQELTGRLIADSRLLGLAVEVCSESAGSEAQRPAVERLNDLFSGWLDASERSRRSGRALSVLAGLESGEADAFPEPLEALSERARNFERSLAENMGRHGLLEAVRAALAFGSDGSDGPEVTRGGRDGLCADAEAEPLFEFRIFRDDPALTGLARALMRIRGAFPDYTRGAVALSTLKSWAEYLRGPCRDFAEDRSLSYSEATSFGHYCLHLLNICDLAARDEVTDAARTALMDAEDEIKEFALAGQRESGDAAVGDLRRYDAMRWAASGPGAYLADRVARLCGGWRGDVERAPVGAPTKLDPELRRRADDVSRQLEVATADGTVDGVASMLRNARLRHIGWMEDLSPDRVLKLLCVALAHARDLPGFDVARPFDVDLGPLARWWREGRADDGDGPSINRRVVRAMLERTSAAELLDGAGATSSEYGLVARAGRQADDGADSARRAESERPAALRLDVEVDDELEALLMLRQSSRAESEQFWEVVEGRLDDLLGASEDGAPDEAEALTRARRSAAG